MKQNSSRRGENTQIFPQKHPIFPQKRGSASIKSLCVGTNTAFFNRKNKSKKGIVKISRFYTKRAKTRRKQGVLKKLTPKRAVHWERKKKTHIAILCAKFAIKITNWKGSHFVATPFPIFKAILEWRYGKIRPRKFEGQWSLERGDLSKITKQDSAKIKLLNNHKE